MEDTMLLDKKTAVIYAAAGAIGGAVARGFAREGARVFLTGRDLARVDAVAKEIADAGGGAETAQVDALDAQAVEEHLDVRVVCLRSHAIPETPVIAANFATAGPAVGVTPADVQARLERSTLLGRLP